MQMLVLGGDATEAHVTAHREWLAQFLTAEDLA